VGLKNTKEMRVNPSTFLVLAVNGREVEQVKSFTYLGSIVTIDGEALEDVQSYQEGQWGLYTAVPSLDE
jgi:hypothetical protein